MLDFDRNKKPIKEISMVPMINVVFLLLIFFLIAGAMQNIEVLDIEEPTAETGEDAERGTITITLGKHDEILGNDTLLGSLDELRAWLGESIKDYPDRLITVRPDARTNATRLIETLDMLREMGGTKVMISTVKI